MIACGNVNLFHKLTGGTKAPPYAITARCATNCNLKRFGVVITQKATHNPAFC